MAVKDLEQSRADFEALGFVMKPGRPHNNGIRNAHVKFPDGTEIELIATLSASDGLSSDYLDWLKGGDGPARLGFFASDVTALKERLSLHNLALTGNSETWTVADPPALKRVFFSRRQHSPTDQPRHFAHSNTAFSLSGVWLAGADAERRLLATLRGTETEIPTCHPFGSVTGALSLPEAKIVFLPATAQLVPGRSIVGATVIVRNLNAARHSLASNGIAFDQSPGCNAHSLWVGPGAAHGMWLEFRQQSTP